MENAIAHMKQRLGKFYDQSLYENTYFKPYQGEILTRPRIAPSLTEERPRVESVATMPISIIPIEGRRSQSVMKNETKLEPNAKLSDIQESEPDGIESMSDWKPSVTEDTPAVA